MSSSSVNYKNFFYPPGGILLWIIILVEIITFGFALVALAYNNHLEPEIFASSRGMLNTHLATFNTLLLLVSGYFMADAVHGFRANNLKKAKTGFSMAMVGGLLFVGIKSVEYYGKISMDIGLTTNTFFTYYWLLTGFHLVHVLIGLVILLVLRNDLKKKPEALKLEDVEAGAAFWHLCDLIWLVLFPMLYLI